MISGGDQQLPASCKGLGRDGPFQVCQTPLHSGMLFAEVCAEHVLLLGILLTDRSLTNFNQLFCASFCMLLECVQ